MEKCYIVEAYTSPLWFKSVKRVIFRVMANLDDVKEYLYHRIGLSKDIFDEFFIAETSRNGMRYISLQDATKDKMTWNVTEMMIES